MPQHASAWTTVLTMLAFWVGSFVCVATQSSQGGPAQPDSKVRVIPRSTQPIADRLTPDDSIVQINQLSEFFEIAPAPSAQRFLEILTEDSQYVAVVEIHEAAGILVDGGTWIHTRVTGVIREVLKSSGNRRLLPEQPIDVQTWGGELRIAKVTVRTNDALTLKPKRQYLMFLNFSDEWKSFRAEGILLVDAERLVNLSPVDPYLPKLDGLRLTEVRTRVSALVKR